MKQFYSFISMLLLVGSANAQFTISGHVYDKSDGESLPGATIYLPDFETGTATNAFGFYSLSPSSNQFRVLVSYLGYQQIDTTITLTENQQITFYLQEDVGQLEEIEVTAAPIELQEQVNSTRMGTIKLQPKEISSIPTLGGESDLIKIAQLLPGVTSGGEGTTGMFVRGGTDDQNLVILDDAVVYNLGHLFGFFSVFNSDAIKNVELVKGGFPANQGGRLSSVMDVRMNEGSLQRYNIRGGIGLLTSRLTIDGPIIPNKMSFMFAGRRTYIDKVFQTLGVSLPYYFYDYNAKLNYKISENDRIYFSTYLGDDVLAFDETTETDEGDEDLGFGFKLGNFTSTLRWNHIYENQKMFSNVTLHQTRFKYDISGKFIDNNVLIRSQIQDVGISADWEYFETPENKIIWGAQSVGHFFRPNVIGTSGEISDFIEEREGALIQNLEGAIYLANKRELLSGNGESYGLELLVRKNSGFFTGWASYSISKTSRNFDELNHGRTFPAKYDRRHVANLVSLFELNDRVSFSAVWTYQSGAWFTPQTGQFLMPNASLTAVELIPIYGERNGTPLGASHRLDINFILKPRGKRRFGGEWHIGAYNFYNRAAPFRVVIDNNGVAYQYVQEGLFGFIPSIAYNFNFSSK